MPGVTTGEAGAGAEVVAALVVGKVAGVLSGADQASYLLDLQIALHPTTHNCTTRGANNTPSAYRVKTSAAPGTGHEAEVNGRPYSGCRLTV